jgi:hypothetical protein
MSKEKKKLVIAKFSNIIRGNRITQKIQIFFACGLFFEPEHYTVNSRNIQPIAVGVISS